MPTEKAIFFSSGNPTLQYLKISFYSWMKVQIFSLTTGCRCWLWYYVPCKAMILQTATEAAEKQTSGVLWCTFLYLCTVQFAVIPLPHHCLKYFPIFIRSLSRFYPKPLHMVLSISNLVTVYRLRQPLIHYLP